MIKGICWILWALWRKIQTLTARLVFWFDFPTSDHTPCIILQLKRCIFMVLLNVCTLLVMSLRFMEMPYKCSVIFFYCFQLNELGMNGEKVVATKEEVRNQMYCLLEEKRAYMSVMKWKVHQGLYFYSTVKNCGLLKHWMFSDDWFISLEPKALKRL